MKATELRIGNLIFQSGQITTIENISRSINDWERVNNKRLFDCTPIPLTEEWLLKFGFEKTKENFCTYDLGKISIYMPSIYYEEGRTYFNSWVIIEKSPKYVHQLQNLYFALTGEELKI